VSVYFVYSVAWTFWAISNISVWTFINTSNCEENIQSSSVLDKARWMGWNIRKSLISYNST